MPSVQVNCFYSRPSNSASEARHIRRGFVAAGPPKLRYLFREQATFYELTLHLQQQIKQQLRQIDPQLLGLPNEEAVAKLVDQYTLDVPVLDRDHITESDPVQVQMEVPAFTQNRAFFGPGRHFVPAMAITINIPFHGDANLLRYSANGFGGNYIDAQMTNNSIVMTHTNETSRPRRGQERFRRPHDAGRQRPSVCARAS